MVRAGGIRKKFKVTSNSWELHQRERAPRSPCWPGRPLLLNIESYNGPPTATSFATVGGQAALSPSRVRRRRRVLHDSEGERFVFDYVPDIFRPNVRGDRGGDQPLVQRRGQPSGQPPGFLPRTRWPSRSRPRLGGRPPVTRTAAVPRHRVPAQRRGILARLPVRVPPVRGLADVDITRSRWRGRPGAGPA